MDGMSTSWLARGEPHLPTDLDWLTPTERDYADRQRFTKRRIEFLVARLAAKSAITRSVGLPGTELRRVEIRHEPTGAPFVCVDGDRPPLSMSLTDRAGWAVCLVQAGTAHVGCDLELVEPRSAAFVKDYLNESEQHYVRAAGEGEAGHLAANLVWSAKESALKVLGTGLRRDTRSVTVHLGAAGAGWQPLRVETAEGATFPGWWRRFGSFVLTTAGEQDFPPPVALEEPPLLDAAEPTHSWTGQPAVTSPAPSPAPPHR